MNDHGASWLFGTPDNSTTQSSREGFILTPSNFERVLPRAEQKVASLLDDFKTKKLHAEALKALDKTVGLVKAGNKVCLWFGLKVEVEVTEGPDKIIKPVEPEDE